MIVTNLIYVLNDQNQVLLGLKKKGFGEGLWNGPGGKVKPGESPEEAAKRELLEEVGIQAAELESRGILYFVFHKTGETAHPCHVYVCRDYTGSPAESDEMIPKWFNLDDIPYDRMWEDDTLWLDTVLRGGNVNLKCWFDENNKALRHEWL